MKSIEYIDKRLNENKEDDEFRFKMAGFKHNEKKIKLSFCYHVCEVSKKDLILSEGLEPKQPNINEPRAVYLTPDINSALSLAKLIYGEKKQKEDFIIFKVDTTGLILFEDPFSIREGGVYSLKTISSDRIKIYTIIDFDIIRNEKNWKEFRNWWFWKQSKKPIFVKKFNLPVYKGK